MPPEAARKREGGRCPSLARSGDDTSPRARRPGPIEARFQKEEIIREFFLAALILVASTQDRESRRFLWSKEQGFDESCGLQALACLLELYWGLPAQELGLARELGLSPEEDLSVSIGDLERLLELRGFSAEAWRVDFGQLPGLAASYAPLVIHYAKPAGHFALLLAADDERLVVADPSAGTIVLRRADFERQWQGTILLARLPGKHADDGTIREAVAEADGQSRLVELAARRATRTWP